MKTMSELIEWFQLNYPYIVHQMRNCNHNRELFDKEDYCQNADGSMNYDLDVNPYHQEGDIWTHTMMVCKQAENSPYLIKIAALLHDIGKPDTRNINPKNGYVSFFNHDAVSAFKALNILKRPELNLKNSDIIHIFNLIALHTQVFKQDLDQLQNTFMGNQELADDLIRLGTADSDGRFTSTPSHTRKDFFNVPILGKKESKKEVIIMCGVPGSGKSTYIDKNFPEAVIVSRDNCLMDVATSQFPDKNFTYNEAFKKVNQKLVDKALKGRFFTAKCAGDTGTTIVVDMTHMSKKSRKKSLSYFGPEYKKKCVVMLTDLETIYLRNQNRTGKVIDNRVIQRMMKSFYPPMLNEFDEIEYVL